MKPRIFISSTFYDLKYIREDLANFVRSYGYEPILFEDGDIGYTPGKTLDSSCYESMRNSDMVILIIGGEYGSAASGEKKDEFKECMSVTRNEFRTAVESGIPIFVMIDKKVMAEYGVYEANYNAIEKENMKMTFPTTKNVNVFRFIKEIKGIVTLPIQEFERSSDIKGFISKQWADMFKNYLSSLRNEKENRKIESSVNEMKALIQKMDIMLDNVGKNVLSNSEEYKTVIDEQKIILFCNYFVDAVRFTFLAIRMFDIDDIDVRIEFITKVLNYLEQTKNIKEDGLDLLRKQLKVFNVESISMDVNLIDKCDILHNNQNMKKIVKILSQKDYFIKMINEIF